MAQQNILDRVKSLEMYFKVGLQEATGLRKQLENIGAPVAPNGGLSDEQKTQLISKRMGAIGRGKRH